MSEKLLAIFAFLGQINPLVYTLVISLVPLIELRGAIPAAIAMGVPPWSAFFYSVVGSMIPAFFIIPLFAWALNFLEKKGWFPWLTRFLNDKFVTKAHQVAAQNAQVEKSDQSAWKKELLKFWAIVIFVGIPLPGTGVYTGSAVASLIKMPFWRAFFAVLLGDIIAGVIMTLISMGVVAII
ncbi:small multi-drug export protein [bacterium]|nr:small multi-drug export protein [bacterium]